MLSHGFKDSRSLQFFFLIVLKKYITTCIMYFIIKYHILKTYIKQKKHKFITLPIYNKIMIKKMAQK